MYHKVIIINVLLILFWKIILHEGFYVTSDDLSFCNEGNLRTWHGKRQGLPDLPLVLLRQLIVLSTLLWQLHHLQDARHLEVFAGGHDKSNIFNKIVIVWCICLHMALDYGFLMVVKKFFIPRAQQRWSNVCTVNLSPQSWTTWASLGYQANHVFSKFLAMAPLDLVSIHTSSTDWF